MLNPQQAFDLYVERARYFGPLHTKMDEVLEVYLGRTTINLPDLDQIVGSSVPNLLAQGVDQMAGRVASVPTMITFTPEDSSSRRSVRKADTAMNVLDGWGQQDRLSSKMKIRARQLLALGQAPVTIRWDHDQHRPIREVRRPTECYPNPETIDGTSAPVDVIFAYRRSVGWLKSHGYADAIITLTRNRELQRDTEMLLIEYVDSDGRMLCLTGASVSGPLMPSVSQVWHPETDAKSVLLEWAPLPFQTAFVPTRIALDGSGGQFDSMIGMFYQQSKMMALDVIAVEKSIFADTYLVGRPSEMPRFIDGPYDGRSGKINIVTGGDIHSEAPQPGFQTAQTVDRLERNQRVTAGIPPDFGGESGSNIRTGVRGAAVLSSVIDFPVAEAQEVFAFALADENKAMIKLAKMYDGSATRTIYVGSGNRRKPITYVADDVFTHEDHVVSYPVNGTDMNGLLIGLSQRVGGGWMSLETAARLDPFITDPIGEHDAIVAEGLERALLQGVEQQAAMPATQGGMPPTVIAQIMQLVKSDQMDLADALVKVTNDAAKAAQAQQAQAGMPGGAPPSGMDQGAGAAQAALTGAVPGPSSDQKSVSDLLNTLRRPVRTVNASANVASGGV